MKFRTKSMLAAIMTLAGASSLVAGDVTSKTFFTPRTTSSDAGLELALSNYNIYHSNYPIKPYKRPEHKAMFLMQNTYFYQESDSGSDLARYFLLDKKTELEIKENGLGDIGSQAIGLVTDDREFDALFKIRPERRVYGDLFNIHMDASSFIEGLWLNVLIPIVKVKHDIELKCCERGPRGEAKNSTNDCIETCEDAFNNSDWLHGRLSRNTENRSGVDDVQVKLGWNFWHDAKNHWGIYGVASLPTGHRPQSDFLFEPTVGSRHWGLGLGTNFDWRFWEIEEKHIFNFMADVKWRYHFSASEHRSFDLCNGPWTRYLTVANACTPDVPLDGINFFTHNVRVRPRNMVDLWLAAHYHYEEWNIELGYNLWWRDSEQVRLGKSFDSCCRDFVLFDWSAVEADCPPRPIVSSSCATIDQARFGRNAAPSDAELTRVTDNQINIHSAEHGKALSHKFYLGGSYNTNFLDHPASLGIGTSYEWANNNKALDQWAIWLKTSFGF